MREIFNKCYDDVDFHNNLILQSNDSPVIREFEISLEAVRQSALIYDMISDCEDDAETVIPLPNVSGNILIYAIEYMEEHVKRPALEIEKPVKLQDGCWTMETLSDWEKKFILVDLGSKHAENYMKHRFICKNETCIALGRCRAPCTTCVKVTRSEKVDDEDRRHLRLVVDCLLAANFMNIKPMLELLAAYCGSMIRGKPVEYIRQLFGLEDDFTEEDKKIIASEMKWCEEPPM